MASRDFQATIGIECHVQLKTVSKLFSAAGNDARSASPNTLVNHIDFGLPGALPTLNLEALTLAARAALALKSKPQLFSTFDRKHYFYPDLPMGYQITQYDQPIIVGGQVDFNVEGEAKTVAITRAHLEADAGKSVHPEGVDYSLVDLNRAGTPLLEIVSEPDMHSPAEAKAYAKELYLLMRYAGVSEGDLYHGNMRFDVNVSVSRDAKLGIRSETKNLNSFRAVEKAVAYEIKRQVELIEAGKKIVQETRGWNEAKQKTTVQRTKENADDYRYMPDPDLPPIEFSTEQVELIASEMPPTPEHWRRELKQMGLTEHQIEILIEANIEFGSADYLNLLVSLKAKDHDVNQLANWLVNGDIPFMREAERPSIADRVGFYSALGELVQAGKLSSTNVKELILRYLKAPRPPVDIASYAESEGLLQQSDTAEIEALVDQVIEANSKAVADVRSGEEKAIGFLVGQVMSRSQGRANPSLAREIIVRKLKA